VYDAELVRLICRDIDKAKDDPQKEQELLSLLQAVIREDQEEMRIRKKCESEWHSSPRSTRLSSVMRRLRTKASQINFESQSSLSFFFFHFLAD